MSETLGDLARVVRSKNAGPTLVTIDVLCEEATYARVCAALEPAAIATRYALTPERVVVIPHPLTHAVKIVLPRKIVAGSPGDRDVYGAQQAGPLLALPIGPAPTPPRA